MFNRWMVARRERQTARQRYFALDQAAELVFMELAEEPDAARRAGLLTRVADHLNEKGAVYVAGFGKRGAGLARAADEDARLMLLLAEAEAARAEGRRRQRSDWSVVEQAGRLALDALADPGLSLARRRTMCDVLRMEVTPYLRGEQAGESLETIARGFARLSLRSRRS